MRLRRTTVSTGAAFVTLAFAHVLEAKATTWPLAASELHRIDIAALAGVQSGGADQARPSIGQPPASPITAAARSDADRPAPADGFTRFITWLDRAEDDFQNVVMRRLSVASGDAARTGAATGLVAAAAGDASSRAGSPTSESVRVAQAGKGIPGPSTGRSSSSSPVTDALAPVTEWLEKSAQEFQSVIMRRLSLPTETVRAAPPPVPAAAPAPKASEKAVATSPPPAKPQTEAGSGERNIADRVGDAAQTAKDWLTQAKRDFQERVVDKLAKPDAPASQAPTPQAQQAPPPAAAPTAKASADDAARKKAEDDARAAKVAIDAAERKVRELRLNDQKTKSEADGAAAKAAAAAKQAEEDAQRRKAAVEEAARKAVADQKRADEAAAIRSRAAAEAENAARKAQPAERSTAEQQRLADEAARRKKAESDLQAARAAEEAVQRKVDAERRKSEDAERETKTKERAALMGTAASSVADGVLAKPEAARKTDGGSAASAAASSAPPSISVAKRAVSEQEAGEASATRRAGAEAERAGSGRRAAGSSCRAAGQRVKPPAVYVVVRGDSLWKIARRHYHKGSRWLAIHRANDDKIRDPDLIFPCQRFYIPRL